MRKKAQVSSTLVIMVAGAIGLLVLLIVTGAFGSMFKSLTGKNECQMQFLISSFTKTGGVQTVDPECEPHMLTITKEDLEKNSARAEKSVSTYLAKFSTKPQTVLDYEKQFTGNTDEWVLDETIAKEMKYCWDIAGRGKLDLFSNWAGMMECQKQGSNEWAPCTSEEIEQAYSNKVNGVVALAVGAVTTVRFKSQVAGAATTIGTPLLLDVLTGDKRLGTPPTFCVLCSRIKFGEGVNNKGYITSLGTWLANNPVTDAGTYSKVSYAVYLKNDEFKGISASDKSYNYDTSSAYGVVYARINIFETEDLLTSAQATITGDKSNIPKSIQMIKLVPYSQMRDTCTFLVG